MSLVSFMNKHFTMTLQKYITAMCSWYIIVDWLDTVYFPAHLSRLSASYDYCCERLNQMGIPFHQSKATYFLWVDFSKVSLWFNVDVTNRIVYNNSFGPNCQVWHRRLIPNPQHLTLITQIFMMEILPIICPLFLQI